MDLKIKPLKFIRIYHGYLYCIKITPLGQTGNKILCPSSLLTLSFREASP